MSDTSNSPYAGLPPHPTVGEMLRQVVDLTNQGLQGKAPHATTDETDSSDA